MMSKGDYRCAKCERRVGVTINILGEIFIDPCSWCMYYAQALIKEE